MRNRFIVRIAGRATVCVALAALVFFSRAWLVRTWGSPLPFWDQWDAEAIGLYRPWLDGTLSWPDLFRAHNEHRIVLTRLADLALFVACDGWNPWAQMLLNAALHAGAAAALAAIFWPALPPRSRTFFVGGLALLFTATCGWQNALYGFQSQVYFANLLAVGAIAGLCAGAPLRTGWWFGLAAAVLAFFSNGGGILAAAASLIVGLGFIRGNPHPTRAWVALGLITATIATTILVGADAPQHAAFHVRNASQFFAVLTRCLAWPWIDLGVCCLVMQLPLIWLVVDRQRRGVSLDAAERCALALGLFAVLQAAAITYSRGAVLPESRPLSRYQDPLLLGAAGQLFAMLRIFLQNGRIGRLAGLIWSGVAVGGLIGLTETNFTLHLPFKQAQDRANLAIVRAYASTGDPSEFTRDPNFHGPHPDPHVVQHVIDDPALRLILPASVLGKTDSPVLPWIIRYSRLLTTVSAVLLLGLLGFLLRIKSGRRSTPLPTQTHRLH